MTIMPANATRFFCPKLRAFQRTEEDSDGNSSTVTCVDVDSFVDKSYYEKLKTSEQ